MKFLHCPVICLQPLLQCFLIFFFRQSGKCCVLMNMEVQDLRYISQFITVLSIPRDFKLKLHFLSLKDSNDYTWINCRTGYVVWENRHRSHYALNFLSYFIFRFVQHFFLLCYIIVLFWIFLYYINIFRVSSVRRRVWGYKLTFYITSKF